MSRTFCVFGEGPIVHFLIPDMFLSHIWCTKERQVSMNERGRVLCFRPPSEINCLDCRQLAETYIQEGSTDKPYALRGPKE